MKFQLLPHGSSNPKEILARKGKFEIIIIINQTIDVSNKNTAQTIYKSMTTYGKNERKETKDVDGKLELPLISACIQGGGLLFYIIYNPVSHNKILS